MTITKVEPIKSDTVENIVKLKNEALKLGEVINKRTEYIVRRCFYLFNRQEIEFYLANSDKESYGYWSLGGFVCYGNNVITFDYLNYDSTPPMKTIPDMILDGEEISWYTDKYISTRWLFSESFEAEFLESVKLYKESKRNKNKIKSEKRNKVKNILSKLSEEEIISLKESGLKFKE